MHLLTNLHELRVENNKLEKFNLQIHLMPNLQILGFDWFSYVIPHLDTV